MLFGDFTVPTKIGLIGLGISNLGILSLYEGGEEVEITVRSLKNITLPEPLVARGARLVTGDGYLEGIDEDILYLSPSVRRDTPPLLGKVFCFSSPCFGGICKPMHHDDAFIGFRVAEGKVLHGGEVAVASTPFNDGDVNHLQCGEKGKANKGRARGGVMPLDKATDGKQKPW